MTGAIPITPATQSTAALPTTPPATICIIRLSAIGDCCHTLAVIRSIQAAWPNTPITWIIGRTEFALMQGIDGVEFIIFEKSSGWRGFMETRRQLSGRRFSVLLNMHASMRANLVSTLVSADLRLGYDRDRARDYQWIFTNARIAPEARQHVLDGMFGFIEYLGLTQRNLRWDIPVPDAALQFARQLCVPPGPTCVISPCSSERFRNFRNWNVDRYIALVKHLHDAYGAHVILTGGPTDTERDYGRRIEAAARGKVTNLIGKTDLKQLLAILDGANLLICPDSGPAHMATTVGTPVVGLYATSNRRRTGPYFSQHLVADRYPDAVQKEFGKPVEALRWGQRVRDPEAMNLITLDDVTQRVALVLDPAADAPPSTPAPG